MRRTLLHERAEELNAPPLSAASEFELYRNVLITETLAVLSDLPDYEYMIGMADEIEFLQQLNSIARLLESMFYDFYVDVFVESVLWMHADFLSHGFRLSLWMEQFQVFSFILRRHASPETYQVLVPFFNWLQENSALTTAISNLIKTEALESVGDTLEGYAQYS